MKVEVAVLGSPSLIVKGCGLWTLSCDFVHHCLLKHYMALIAAHLNAGIILVVTVSDRYIISLFPHLHTPSSPSPRP